MKDYFEYKGYLGSAEVDIEGGVLVGKLLFIRDTITYSATSPKALEQAFHEAVDEYLQVCAELGDVPDTPCKGTFNVRVGADLHRDVALAARKKGVTLNSFVAEALAIAVAGPARHQHLHTHQHRVTFDRTGTSPERIATTSQPSTWEQQSYATH